MVKRVASAFLWLLAVGWGFNYISAITGAPPMVSMILGVVVSVFVGIDPLHLFWPARADAPAALTRDVFPVSGAFQT